MFFINHREIAEGKAVIIDIEGPLNSETSSDFEDYINKLLDNGILHIIIDAAGLSFLSSEGIGVMLMIQKIISEKKGQLVLSGLSSETTTLFKLLGFMELFRTAESRADALRILDRAMELKGRPEPGENISDKTGEIPDSLYHKPDKEQNHRAENNSMPESISPLIIDETPERIEPAKKETPLEPFIIKCVNCSSLIRINETGGHICPECSSEFEVTGPGSAVFS
jgi:anti-anti-sigma factor